MLEHSPLMAMATSTWRALGATQCLPTAVAGLWLPWGPMMPARDWWCTPTMHQWVGNILIQWCSCVSFKLVWHLSIAFISLTQENNWCFCLVVNHGLQWKFFWSSILCTFPLCLPTATALHGGGSPQWIHEANHPETWHGGATCWCHPPAWLSGRVSELAGCYSGELAMETGVTIATFCCYGNGLLCQHVAKVTIAVLNQWEC